MGLILQYVAWKHSSPWIQTDVSLRNFKHMPKLYVLYNLDWDWVFVSIVTEDGALTFQKRDIQLLKAYMRAIRSANPNLQNLEESIEYNEILE